MTSPSNNEALRAYALTHVEALSTAIYSVESLRDRKVRDHLPDESIERLATILSMLVKLYTELMYDAMLHMVVRKAQSWKSQYNKKAGQFGFDTIDD